MAGMDSEWLQCEVADRAEWFHKQENIQLDVDFAASKNIWYNSCFVLIINGTYNPKGSHSWIFPKRLGREPNRRMKCLFQFLERNKNAFYQDNFLCSGLHVSERRRRGKPLFWAIIGTFLHQKHRLFDRASSVWDRESCVLTQLILLYSCPDSLNWCQGS